MYIKVTTSRVYMKQLIDIANVLGFENTDISLGSDEYTTVLDWDFKNKSIVMVDYYTNDKSIVDSVQTVPFIDILMALKIPQLRNEYSDILKEFCNNEISYELFMCAKRPELQKRWIYSMNGVEKYVYLYDFEKESFENEFSVKLRQLSPDEIEKLLGGI